ncbi:MAG: NAD(P)-binding domain-containing protein [Burkholderiaceae bacterium]|nr:NAD(P)-binding domain-containing protein [Burkholderiaceae bacterium]HMN64170.1 NAD(P)-binding domain-containing protein [Burkholderiaceae bacterium]
MRTDVAVIGAGHAGLAMSRCLAERSIDHVVLERGEVANSWKTERWDSLRLLTPNWQSRLPGYGYAGADPDGFRTMPETIAFIERYARLIAAPLRTRTAVTSVRRSDDGYRVATEQGDWECRAVVIASGACNVATVPALAEAVPSALATVTAMDYRNPDRLEQGGVLVVGASASGVQIAEEIQRSGRPVTLAVGEHIRMPRTYRGRDIQWWMDAAGVLDQRYEEISDHERARQVPSLQLAGHPDRRMVDLNALAAIGVRLAGRLAGMRDGRALFSGGLANQAALSDLKMNRLLDTIDRWAASSGLDHEVEPPHRFGPTRIDASAPLSLDLAGGEIRTIVWATGYRPDYSWLDVPVLDRKGRMRHTGGVVDSPGMYLMGEQFMRRRKSALIDGAGDDARELCEHLASYLGRRSAGLTRDPAAGRSPMLAVGA